VKTVGAFAKNIQPEIDFCVGGNADFAHESYCGLASSEEGLRAATWCFT
jgi:hypothetical protein